MRGRLTGCALAASGPPSKRTVATPRKVRRSIIEWSRECWNSKDSMPLDRTHRQGSRYTEQNNSGRQPMRLQRQHNMRVRSLLTHAFVLFALPSITAAAAPSKVMKAEVEGNTIVIYSSMKKA